MVENYSIRKIFSGLIDRNSDVFDIFFLTHFDLTMEVVSEWSDGADYIGKLRCLRAKFLEKCAKTLDPDSNHFNTLNHGDLYVYFVIHSNLFEFTEIDRHD